MNRHILALYDTIIDELENQGLADTQVSIEFLPRKSFINKMVRITIHNWDNGRHAYYIIRKEELELKENIVNDILEQLVMAVKDTKQDRMHKEIMR